MRHGSTLALVVSCWMTCVPTPARAQAGGPVEGWVLPDEARGARVAPILLLSRPEVQAELRLKPDQVADVARVIADARHKATQLRGRTDAAAVELRRGVDEEQRAWLETRLTEDQVGRLGEVDLQWEGVAAIATRATVGEALSLSESQKATLARAVADRNKHRGRPVERERDPGVAERHLVQQAWATLSEGQRKRWEKMLGRPVAALAAAPGHLAR